MSECFRSKANVKQMFTSMCDVHVLLLDINILFFCVTGKFRLSFISSWGGPGLGSYDTVPAHSEPTGVLLGRQSCQTFPVFFMLWVCGNHALHADIEVKCSGQQKGFEGTWPAKSGIITCKRDGYQTPQDAFFHITLSESTCRLYFGKNASALI